MPSIYKSPFATSFRTAIKRGTPCSVAVKNIAKRTNKNPNTIFQSLHKAGLCLRQKFNGQWVYWPCEDIKISATQAKEAQVDMWQSFMDWCIVSGKVKPDQIWNGTGSQKDFMVWCRKYFNKQLVPANGTSKTKRRSTAGRKRTTVASRKRNTSTARKSSSRSRRISTAKSRVSKRYRRAA